MVLQLAPVWSNKIGVQTKQQRVENAKRTWLLFLRPSSGAVVT